MSGFKEDTKNLVAVNTPVFRRRKTRNTELKVLRNRSVTRCKSSAILLCFKDEVPAVLKSCDTAKQTRPQMDKFLKNQIAKFSSVGDSSGLLSTE